MFYGLGPAEAFHQTAGFQHEAKDRTAGSIVGRQNTVTNCVVIQR